MDSCLRVNTGRVLVTANAAERLSQDDVRNALCRHLQADQGDLARTGQAAKEPDRLRGCRLLSAHRSAEGLRFWIITEADLATTTILLSEDFR
jgi:hypothetical protein